MTGCQLCPILCKSRKTTVFGEGNPDTEVFFIGEAPGAEENRTGRPFVGPAGQLLRNFIKACGWAPEDVYIANIIKCQPPQNRTPSKEEAANCRLILDLQIRIINPSYIVCLGATAAQSILGVDTPIGQLRGRFYEYNDRKVVCTYHPSFIIRMDDKAQQKETKRKIWQDIRPILVELGKCADFTTTPAVV